MQTGEGSVRRYFGGCFDGARSRPRRQFKRVALAEFQARALRYLPTCRKEIYEALCRIASTDEGVLPFIDRYLDRTEGRSGRKVQQPAAHWSTFILTTRDAQQAEMNLVADADAGRSGSGRGRR